MHPGDACSLLHATNLIKRVLRADGAKVPACIEDIEPLSGLIAEFIQGEVMAEFTASPGSSAIPSFEESGHDPERPIGYSDRLYNEDLAPLKHQTWSAYNIFAFWMSDVHSVGGYVFAGSLFAL
jgi:hypothetical protein